MELELGLAPPNNLFKGFDLNTPTDFLGHAIPPLSLSLCGTKRAFNETFRTLPLFENNHQLHCSNDNKDDEENDDANSNSVIQKRLALPQVNKRGIVGWPPIKSSRMIGGGGGRDEDFETRRSNGSPNSMYVKVNMDGMAIGRKIDLAFHQSYQTLTQALVCMFGIYENKDAADAEKPSYRITYQDKDGDWLLVGDVPWVLFNALICLIHGLAVNPTRINAVTKLSLTSISQEDGAVKVFGLLRTLESSYRQRLSFCLRTLKSAFHISPPVPIDHWQSDWKLDGSDPPRHTDRHVPMQEVDRDIDVYEGLISASTQKPATQIAAAVTAPHIIRYNAVF
ncbi:hypothetical protein ACLOJK_030924 [Asimina triloba]